MNPFTEALERAEKLIADKNSKIQKMREALEAVAEHYGWNCDGPLGEVGNKGKECSKVTHPFGTDDEAHRMAERYAGKDYDKPRVVWHDVWRSYGDEMSLAEFQKAFIAAIENIPSDCLETAKVNIEVGEGGKFLIEYKGPEPKLVVDERVARCKEYVEQTRMNNRLLYERLKRKFENDPAGSN